MSDEREMQPESKQTMRHSEPTRHAGRRHPILAFLGALLSIVYLANPTLGTFELIPDNLPLVGNIDEVTITGLLLLCLGHLGIRILPAQQPSEKTPRGERERKDGL